MMKRVVVVTLRLLSLLVIPPVLILSSTGCSSTDAENQAYRPWGGSQGGWQSGLPSSLTEGR